MKIVIEKLLLPKSYEYEDENYSIIVYGDHVEQINKLDLHVSGGVFC